MVKSIFHEVLVALAHSHRCDFMKKNFFFKFVPDFERWCTLTSCGKLFPIFSVVVVAASELLTEPPCSPCKIQMMRNILAINIHELIKYLPIDIPFHQLECAD